MNLGFIGLGLMGRPMAQHLAAAGHTLHLWARRPESLVPFRDSRAVCHGSPAALAAQAQVVFTMVADAPDVREVLLGAQGGAAGAAAGLTVVDMSTIAPAAAQEIGAALAARGIDFLDAPVSGGVEGAKQGTLAIMVGGTAANLERARPALNAIGQRIAHMGPVGNGQATKAVNQIMCAGINHAVTEALAFAEDQGLPLDKVIEVVSSGAAGNWFLEKRGPTMVRCSFAPGFKLALHHKDLAICKAIAEQRGVTLPVVEMTLAQYRRLMDAGFGDEDISALYREKRKLFDKECGPETK